MNHIYFVLSINRNSRGVQGIGITLFKKIDKVYTKDQVYIKSDIGIPEVTKGIVIEKNDYETFWNAYQLHGNKIENFHLIDNYNSKVYISDDLKILKKIMDEYSDNNMMFNHMATELMLEYHINFGCVGLFPDLYLF